MKNSTAALEKAIRSGVIAGNVEKQFAKDAAYFVRAALGTVQGGAIVLDPSVKKAKGITNFNNAVLPSGRSLAVSHVRVASMANASVVGDEYTNVFADAAIYNAEIRIEQDSKTLLEMPVSAFHSASGEDMYLELDEPIILVANSPIMISIHTPAAAAADTNLEVVFKGVENANR